jgi:hypothetical protein
MRSMRWLVVVASAAAVSVASGAALGAGPWPGLAGAVVSPSGNVRYTAVRTSASTTVKAVRGGAVVASATFDGRYGIPAVTSTGVAGGLSPDGRLLVLVEPPRYSGLRTRSTFLVVSTGRLALRSRIVLSGEFGFDAISPDGRTLYLIHHTSASDLVRYAVRAYDLRLKRLLPGVVVDKRQADEVMRGYPVARATSKRGTWVYTLYTRQEGEPFVHALNAARRTAFCIDLPWRVRMEDAWNARLQLANGDRRLDVVLNGATVARVDTKTMRVG